MTMVAALAACDGIVCVGDGRSFDGTGVKVSDTEIKLFELTPQCVVMPNGGVMDNVIELMAFLKSTLSKIDPMAIYDIAQALGDVFKEQRGIDAEDPYGMLVVGLQKIDDDCGPLLLELDSSDWKPRISEAPFMVGGIKRYAEKIFEESHDATKDVKSANLVALKAMKRTMESSAQVGGSVALWNIKPDQRIRKFERPIIRKLMQDV